MNSNKLKSFRVSKGLTQDQISKLLNVAIATYNRKELGIVDFSNNEIMRVARVLGMSLQDVNDVFFDSELTNRIIS